MSDVSESLQVRTDADEACMARLRSLGFNGFVFRGRQGWLTVVPYGGPGSLGLTDAQLASFAGRLGAPVLNYQVNDSGWGFQLALPDGRTTGFLRWLVSPRELGLTDEQARAPVLDKTVLSAVVSLAKVRNILGAPEVETNEGLQWELFAKAAGFPEYGQLNPTYATDHPEDMRRLGGIEIGSRPESMHHTQP